MQQNEISQKTRPHARLSASAKIRSQLRDIVAPFDVGIRQIPPVGSATRDLVHVTHMIWIGVPRFHHNPTHKSDRDDCSGSMSSSRSDQPIEQGPAENKKKRVG